MPSCQKDVKMPKDVKLSKQCQMWGSPQKIWHNEDHP